MLTMVRARLPVRVAANISGKLPYSIKPMRWVGFVSRINVTSFATRPSNRHAFTSLLLLAGESNPMMRPFISYATSRESNTATTTSYPCLAHSSDSRDNTLSAPPRCRVGITTRICWRGLAPTPAGWWCWRGMATGYPPPQPSLRRLGNI